MPTYPTQEYNDYLELLESMDMAITAVKSFGAMVEHSIRTGENLSEDGYGMERLLNLQCRHLENIATALRIEFASMKTSKLEIKNPEKIAEWAGVSQFVVNRVISIAMGIHLGPPTERHTAKPPHVLKESANASA